MIWREKRLLLAILAVLLLANAVYFFTYRVRYQARLDGVEQDLSQKEQQLEQAHLARLRAEKRYQSYRQIERDVARVYDEHWSTERLRLTALIAEVKGLAQASSLVPPSYGFDQDQAKVSTSGSGTRGRMRELDATEVGISFAVNGTYEQVRRLINLLELSRQFVIIDQIGLNAQDGQSLAVNLHVKTLFRDEKPRVAGKRL